MCSQVNYVLRDGRIFETPKTLQVSPAGGGGRESQPVGSGASVVGIGSGDGTVPYSSLRHSATWDQTQRQTAQKQTSGEDTAGSSGLRSQVVEIDGVAAEHRNILGCRDFHEVLTGYLCETLVVYVVRARRLAIKDKFTRSSDPYLLVSMHYGTPDGSSPSLRGSASGSLGRSPSARIRAHDGSRPIGAEVDSVSGKKASVRLLLTPHSPMKVEHWKPDLNC